MVPRISVRLPVRLLQDSPSYYACPSAQDRLTHCLLRSFSSTAVASAGPASTPKKKRPRYQDPWANKLAEARRNANLTRREELKAQRAIAIGDPIRGITTPFIESFDTALPPSANTILASTDLDTSSSPSTKSPSSTEAKSPDSESHLDHFLSPPELSSSLDFSHRLTAPYISPDRSTADPQAEADALAAHTARHATATAAIARIVSLRNASSAARTRANIKRCIDVFGRHKTDTHLRRRAPSAASLDPSLPHAEPTPRAGPDTGSSEVQIAILTAKIRVLADHYEAESKNDKVNKRNLRLLLHRRQKLLKYLQRRERGGERWVHLVQTLGLTDATWKGQIAVE